MPEKSSPAEAFRQVSEHPDKFDLIITDYDMPETNGLDLAKDIQNIAPTIPVLIVSGRRNFLNVASEVKNVRKVLMKPYSKNIIADAIREVLLSTEKNDG